jgi:hypothetical protein
MSKLPLCEGLKEARFMAQLEGKDTGLIFLLTAQLIHEYY